MNANCTPLSHSYDPLLETLFSEIGQLLAPWVASGHRMPPPKDLGSRIAREVSRCLAEQGISKADIAEMSSIHPRTLYYLLAPERPNGTPPGRRRTGRPPSLQRLSWYT
jgi:hypothetical protein